MKKEEEKLIKTIKHDFTTTIKGKIGASGAIISIHWVLHTNFVANWFSCCSFFHFFRTQFFLKKEKKCSSSPLTFHQTWSFIIPQKIFENVNWLAAVGWQVVFIGWYIFFFGDYLHVRLLVTNRKTYINVRCIGCSSKYVEMRKTNRNKWEAHFF